ncbi:MFS transporter [Ensifer adhaerens]|uniref:MFS transporter n=1 Tax=Ensifer adhaerens TaxID=106592 RepID=A0A9Q8YJ74_ENSAD|nr:MFS transporter [Ensifer adhaerens]USJ28414.1 MFS transporter [Ensifer adhaerens]
MHNIASANSNTSKRPKVTASWAAVVAIGVGACLIVTSEFLPVGLLREIAHDLGVSEGEAGLMVTLPGIVAAFSALLTIAYVGHVDRRRVLWVLVALLAVSNLVVALSSGFTVLLVGRILLGISLGGFWTIAGSLGPRLRHDTEGAKATAVIFSGISIGTVAGVPLGVSIGTHFGWRSAFSATATVAIVVVVALVLLLPAIPAQRGNGLRAVPDVLARPMVRLALAATILLFAAQFAAYTYITPFLVRTSQVSPTMLSAFLLTFGVTGFFGNLYGGWMAAWNSRMAVAGSALLLSMAIALLALTGHQTWMAAVAVALWGFAFGMAPVALQTFALNSASDHLEAAAALLVFVLQIALGVGSFAGGIVADRYTSIGAFMIGIVGAFLAFAIVAVTWAKRPEN